MKTRDIIGESSGYSLEGSYTPDLIFSKLWLAHELEKLIDQPIPVAYILGSWYSNLSTILRKKNIPVEKIIDVDKNRSWLRQGQKIQKAIGIDNVDYMSADANKIDYRQLQEPGLVINSSLNDIADHGWFQHIPPGTLVVLQGRDNVAPGAEHTYNSPEDILEMYPLDKVLYQGQVTLEDPETQYQRSMVIGIKGNKSLNENLSEAKVGSLQIGDISIVVDDHAIEQTYMRDIAANQVDQALRKLPTIKDYLHNMTSGDKVWVTDPATGISLGLRKISGSNLNFQFKTVVKNRTYDSVTPDVQLNELMFKGSVCTKDCSGHRAGYDWSMRKGGVDAASWSPSFNKGAALYKNGY